MNCPRCESSVLLEREREGIMVDSCPSCRGVWLDRGELEKLITRAVNDLTGQAAGPARFEPPPRSIRQDSQPYRQDSQPYRHDGQPYRHDTHPKRKRHWLESLGEIFD